MLEFYDFAVYAFFAVSIGQAFFPARNPFVNLLLSVATFGVGFFTRPLGAVYIGDFTDRVGRKPAMMLTISLMAIGTSMVALTPGYATIGIAAPIVVVLARLIQGFALGGDVGPATAFLIEQASANRRGIFGSFQIASQNLSVLLSGVVGVGLSAVLSGQSMHTWGWRAAFLFGLLLIPVGVSMRRTMPETLERSGDNPKRRRQWPVRTLAVEHGRAVLLGVLICMAVSVATYTAIYLTTYALTTLHLPASISLGVMIVVGFCGVAGALAGGLLSDWLGSKFVAVVSRLVTIALVYPVFLLMTRHPSAPVFYVTAAVFTLANAPSAAASIVFIAESFPTTARGLGLAVTYALGVSVFGGTTQFVITWLIGTTGNALSPAWYVAGTGIVGLIATLMLPAVPRRIPSLRCAESQSA
jgi:MFS family permease